ncbi:MAG TPA: bifunctional nicotinamidase/pyrazinamidase [Rhodopila sp.]|nr:bifunctional nicotinamidase/pyrazinamidase [Rhodopila sp.]
MGIDPQTDILGLIDVQPTFMPAGELPVDDGDAVVPVINRLLASFHHAFATQDWHPADHASFASAHAGKRPYDTIMLPYGPQVLWPDHGIAGSPNAMLHPDIDQARIEVIIRKGFRRTLDSYSAFFENDRTTPTGLEGWLRQRGFTRIFFCGLATDFCVAWSAEDAIRTGFEAVVIEDGCRGIGLPSSGGRTTIDEARERLTAQGVRFIESAKLNLI